MKNYKIALAILMVGLMVLAVGSNKEVQAQELEKLIKIKATNLEEPLLKVINGGLYVHLRELSTHFIYKNREYKLKTNHNYITDIPILTYHEINELPKNGENLKGLYVHPERFAEHLDILIENNYSTITMQEVYDHWINNTPLPSKPVVITFDDGYRSHYEMGFKELYKRGMVGTFYIFTDVIGRQNGVTEDMIKEMHLFKMEIGGHTASHINLSKNNIDYKRELLESKSILEEITGAQINHFSYPYGSYNQKAISFLKEYGYLTSTTVKHGSASRNQGLYELNRITVYYTDTPLDIIKKLKE